MDFFSRMMSFGEKLGRKKIKSEQSPECIRIYELQDELNTLLKGTKYVARSEYAEIIPAYKELVEFFRVLQNSKMLKSYCAQNGIAEGEVLKIIDLYDHLGERVDAANDEYITKQMLSEKEYLDNILKDVDPVIMLDEDQRKVILTDEDYSLVIAGAGAGKTTTVAAKVKYLVEKKGIEPRDILVISFTNKAVGELREKINKDLHIDCPIATFHSTGNAILRINDPEPLNIFDGSKLYFLLQDYFKRSILTNEVLVNNLIMFFASYFEAPYEGADLNEFFNKTAKANYTTMRSELDEFRLEIVDARTKKKVTIQNEVLKSYQEVQVANFLYLNNIDYEYEPIYPYNITFSRKPYTPDFIIRQGDKVAYIEHFGVTEDGKNSRFTEEELVRYKHSVNDKVKLHRKHGTSLIYTFSEFNDKRSLLKHLQEKLEAIGFELTPRSNKEVMDKLIASEESRYVRKLVNLICRFITNFKTNGFGVDEFDRMYHSTTNVRSRLFLNICQDCYLEYQRYLKENNAVDFEDMVNESAPDFAEPFVSAVSVVPVEEKGMPAQKSMQKSREVNIPEVKTERSVSGTIVSAKDTQIEVPEKTKVLETNDSNDMSFKGKDLMELARNTINCLGHISEDYYFGISILISVLRGGNRKQIVKHKLNEVPEYGIYADMNRDDMRAVVQWLINHHYMLKTKAKYPVLHPTYDGIHYDDCITKKQIKDLKKYLEDLNREIFEDEDTEE